MPGGVSALMSPTSTDNVDSRSFFVLLPSLKIFVIKDKLGWHFKATLRQVRGITLTSSYCTFDNPTSPHEYWANCDIRLGTWPTTCSTWLISFFMATACGSQGLSICHSQINSSPLNGLVHKLLYLWYPRTIEFNENVYIFCCLHNFWYRKPWHKRLLCFTEYISKIFFNWIISQIRQIFFHQMCLCSEFANVSLHTVACIIYLDKLNFAKI